MVDNGPRMSRRHVERIRPRAGVISAHARSWLALLAGLLAVASGCTRLLLGDSEAGLVLEDLMGGPQESRLEARTGEPSRASLRFTAGGAPRAADLYLPATRARAGLVLVPGLTPAGKDDSRLVALARTLARVDFAVLVPDIPGFRSLQLRASDVGVLIDAIETLDALPEMQPRLPLGIGGFSYAVGPAIMASLDPRVRERVDLVVGVGGYYDLRELVAYYTTGAHRGDTEGPTPYDSGKWIFALGIAEQLPDAGDRAALEALALDMVYSSSAASAPTSPADLTPGGAALLELLTNTTPERVPALLAQLPATLREEIRALNPAEADLDRLHARMLLLHGRGDDIIPYGESIALAEALPGEQVSLYLVDGMAHVELSPGLGDIDTLLAMVDALLAARAAPGT